MRPDVKLSAVMTAVQNRCKSKAPHLEAHLTKNCGARVHRPHAAHSKLDDERIMTTVERETSVKVWESSG